MIQMEIAKVYSKALFDLGKEEKKLLEYKEELAEVIRIVKEYADLEKVFYHPRVLPDDKKKIVSEVFGNELSNSIYNFINLLIDKRRESYLELIYQEYGRMVNKEKNILEVEVISAIEISDRLTDILKEKLNQLLANEVVINLKVDPKIIGGLILKIGDRVIDGSIKNKISSLEQKIAQIPVSELGV